MSDLNKALRLDCIAAEIYDARTTGILHTCNIIAAANAYCGVIEQGDAPLDAYVNLAFIYWQATEFGFVRAANIDAAFISIAANNLESILESANVLFPNAVEGRFWGKYFNWSNIGAPFTLGECKTFLQEQPDCVVPYFYLFTATPFDVAFREGAERLYQECRKILTIKNRYIMSVLDSTFRTMKRGEEK